MAMRLMGNGISLFCAKVAARNGSKIPVSLSLLGNCFSHTGDYCRHKCARGCLWRPRTLG